jgi:hypothetical protein
MSAKNGEHEEHVFILEPNVYLTPPGTQKELKKKSSASMSGKTPKFFTECKSGHF